MKKNKNKQKCNKKSCKEQLNIIEKELKDYYEKIKDIDTKSITINDFYDSDIKMIKDLFNIAQNKILESIKNDEIITKGRLIELLCFGSSFVLNLAKGYDYSKRDYNTHHKKELKEYEQIKKIMTHYGIKNIQDLKHTIHTQGVGEQEFAEYKREVVEPLEKKAKVLEIIRKKRVDVKWLDFCKTSVRYNFANNCDENNLTKKEFNLLKEVLGE